MCSSDLACLEGDHVNRQTGGAAQPSCRCVCEGSMLLRVELALEYKTTWSAKNLCLSKRHYRGTIRLKESYVASSLSTVVLLV